MFTKPKNVKELESPIELEPVKTLTADYTFKVAGLFTIELKWNAQEDDRAVYRIYVNKDGKETLLDSVEGKGSYEIPYANLFSGASYKIVPYNIQTKEKGKEPITFSLNCFPLNGIRRFLNFEPHFYTICPKRGIV